MKAKKGNKVYTINPKEKNAFLKAGYDVYEDDGKLISYGAGKTIALEKYDALKEENKKLREQVDALAEKVEELKKARKKEK